MTARPTEPMWKLAYDLARSGRYKTWIDVADALSRRGISEAPGLLDNPLIRRHLDGLCHAARSRHGDDLGKKS
jgi:hypothetical protein